LYDAIAKQNYPSWTLYVQMMTVEQAKQVPFQPFDLTKIWPQADFPLQPVGRLVLNENPTDYFAQIEQLAFSPSHMIPGIEPSPDKMLQARLFSYPDTHRHRLGPNNHLIPVNRQAPSGPPGVVLQNYQRDGVMQVSANGGGGPNYFPNSFGGPQPDPQVSWHGDSLSGQVQRVDTGDEDNTSQVRTFYLSVLGEAGRDRLTTNIAGHLINAQSFLQERVVQVFGTVHPDYGRRITDKLRALKAAGVVPPVKIQPARLHPPRTVAKPRCPYGYSSKL
jgi:catalase